MCNYQHTTSQHNKLFNYMLYLHLFILMECGILQLVIGYKQNGMYFIKIRVV